MTLNAIDIEAFCPSLKNTMVYVILRGWIGECESEMELIQLLVVMVGLNKLLEAVCNVLPELICITCLQLLRHAVFGLDDIKL